VNGDERSRALLHDTAACYRFVKSTAAACKLNGGFPSYLPPTRKLLTHIWDISVSTQDFLSTFASDCPDDPAKYRNKREQLSLIRAAWKNLHLYVQPAVDANTLNVPTELVELLTQRVRLIETCESLEFAVIHTDKLNYFQFPPGDFRQTVIDLSEIVTAKPVFSPDLGLIALPRSQSQHLFLNGLLAHEVGHCVFSKLRCLDRLEGVILVGLTEAFKPPNDVDLKADLRGQLSGVLQDWAEELFCDLFGVCLLGPSFVLASIELFDLANILAHDGTIDPKAAKSHFNFEWSHPARLFRLWRQTVLLENLGWWNEINASKSHHIRVMRDCGDLRQSSFSFEQVGTSLGSKIIDAFCRILEDVENEVARVTEKFRNEEGHTKEISEFVELRDVIGTYLCHAVVPSTLHVDDEFKNPSAIVLLNAAHLFYLSGIEDLMGNSDKSDHTKIDWRDTWMERVENWTTKALEDISLPNLGGA
jgi:hypothetical protein